MIETYAKILKKGLTDFLGSMSKEQQIPEDNTMLVIRKEKGKTGAYLYNGSKFVRKVGFIELVKQIF